MGGEGRRLFVLCCRVGGTIGVLSCDAGAWGCMCGCISCIGRASVKSCEKLVKTECMCVCVCVCLCLSAGGLARKL